MARKKTVSKSKDTRRRYTDEFKKEAQENSEPASKLDMSDPQILTIRSQNFSRCPGILGSQVATACSRP